jgi:type I site-specific restriction endonuclease
MNASLNLPVYDVKITERGGKTYIFDLLRRKEVVLTPEEWIRQHFVNFLITVKNTPSQRIANEVSIHLNGTSKRCDSVIYNDFLEPVAIVEYKSPEISITEKVFNQIARYNYVLKVPYLIVSNGLAHYCCHIDYENMKYEFLRDIPPYEEIKNASK